MTLESMLTGALPPGRYRLPAPVRIGDLRAELAVAGWDAPVVDGTGVRDRDALFDAFGAALSFPDWFGGNWDAFADCLGDLSWLRGEGIGVLWRRSGVFAEAAPEASKVANAAIDAAIATRVAGGLPPLYILFPATGELTDGDGWTLRPEP
jgi:hypothetical protein